MNKIFKIYLLMLGLILFSSFMLRKSKEIGEGKKVYNCMVQLTNYMGEGAYVAVSIVDQDNKYLETLRVLGDERQWYPDLTRWWGFTDNAGEKLDGMTGATISGGERSIFVLEIDEQYLNAGNNLRFETAVEFQKYYEKDLQVSLDSALLSGKFEGQGYVRYVRIMPK